MIATMMDRTRDGRGSAMRLRIPEPGGQLVAGLVMKSERQVFLIPPRLRARGVYIACQTGPRVPSRTRVRSPGPVRAATVGPPGVRISFYYRGGGPEGGFWLVPGAGPPETIAGRPPGIHPKGCPVTPATIRSIPMMSSANARMSTSVASPSAGSIRTTNAAPIEMIPTRTATARYQVGSRTDDVPMVPAEGRTAIG